MTTSSHIPLTSKATDCFQCQLGKFCLPVALQNDDIIKLDNIVKRGKSLHKGDHIYHSHDNFNSVYAIKAGYIKTYRTTDEGKEQITGFYLPGEIFGMDGISNKHHTSHAMALTTASICSIPFTQLSQLTLELPELQQHLFQIMGHQIESDQHLITLLSKKSSEERIATFIILFANRYASRNRNADRLSLPMSRTDIGNYLGLTVETVSRIFSRFNKIGIISLNQKEVTINDMNALAELAHLEC